MRNDGTGRHYHFTSNLKKIRDGGELWAGADGSVYLVAHGANYKLGINSDLTKLQVVVFEAECGVTFTRKPFLPLYDLWKRKRGEFTSKFANDVVIKKFREGTLRVCDQNLSAIFVDEASYRKHQRYELRLSWSRLVSRHIFTGYEASILWIWLMSSWPRLGLAFFFAQYLFFTPLGAVVCLYYGRKTGRLTLQMLFPKIFPQADAT